MPSKRVRGGMAGRQCGWADVDGLSTSTSLPGTGRRALGKVGAAVGPVAVAGAEMPGRAVICTGFFVRFTDHKNTKAIAANATRRNDCAGDKPPGARA